MHYIGLDVHKRVVEAAVLDGAGTLVHRERFDCTRAALQQFAERWLTAADALALEATTNSWEVVGVLEPYVGQLVVSNPLRTRAIAEAKVKTDRVDARVLAELLRADYLPSVWRPDPETRELRHLTARRAALVSARTAAKNRLHAVLHQRLIHAPLQQLFGPRGRRWLAELELAPLDRAAVESELRLLDGIDAEIAALEQHLSGTGYRDPRVRLLLTLPGVDRTVAQALLAAWGDVHRFPTPSRAASYLGLVPSTRQSAEHCYHGPITKRGRGHARWMLVQAAHHLGTNPGPLGVFFRRIARKKGRNVAVVATARKLATIAWQLLITEQPYRYALPRPTEHKLARLRVAATGTRRRTGPKKGTPRPVAHGTGRTTRAVPALDRLYASEALPRLAPLAEGERRMLESNDLVNFARALRIERRVPRRRAAETSSTRPGGSTGELTRS